MGSRTPLLSSIARLMQEAWKVGAADIPADCRPTLSRREFLSRAGKASAGLVLAPVLTSCSSSSLARQASPSQPSVAIIGAGIAGLVCAYELKKHGIRADIYEGSDRVGGRLFSARDKMPDDQVVELGGELIDSDHQNVRRLCVELGMQLRDLQGVYPGAREAVFFIDDEVLSDEQIMAGFVPLAKRMATLVAASEKSEEEFLRVDALSIREWLEAQADVDARVRKLLDVAYCGEFGLETDQLSLLNLLLLIDYEDQQQFHIFGNSDERFHVAEGNDALTTRLGDMFADQIEFNHLLVAISRATNGRYKLTFEVSTGFVRRNYDKVVLALPFTMLRGVNLKDLPLPPLKQSIIRELGYGTNTKIMASFKSRIWKESYSSNGSVFANSPLQSVWDTSRGQKGPSGVLTFFLGGNAGIAATVGSAVERFEELLPHLDQVFPGAAKEYNRERVVRMSWPIYPYARGSFSCYKPGQTRWAAEIGKRVDNLHFCGEHTSIEAQGYIEGACESGARVAKEITGDFA